MLTGYLIARPSMKIPGFYAPITSCGPYGDQNGPQGIALGTVEGSGSFTNDEIAILQKGGVVTKRDTGDQYCVVQVAASDKWRQHFREFRHHHDKIAGYRHQLGSFNTLLQGSQHLISVNMARDLEALRTSLIHCIEEHERELQGLLGQQWACDAWWEMTGQLPDPKIKGTAMMLPSSAQVPVREGLDRWLLYRLHLEEMPDGAIPRSFMCDPVLSGTVRLGWLLATDVDAAADEIKRRLHDIHRNLAAQKPSPQCCDDETCPSCGARRRPATKQEIHREVRNGRA